MESSEASMVLDLVLPDQLLDACRHLAHQEKNTLIALCSAPDADPLKVLLNRVEDRVHLSFQGLQNCFAKALSHHWKCDLQSVAEVDDIMNENDTAGMQVITMTDQKQGILNEIKTLPGSPAVVGPPTVTSVGRKRKPRQSRKSEIKSKSMTERLSADDSKNVPACEGGFGPDPNISIPDEDGDQKSSTKRPVGVKPAVVETEEKDDYKEEKLRNIDQLVTSISLENLNPKSEGDHPCVICGMAFSGRRSEASMRRHMKRHGVDWQSYQKIFTLKKSKARAAIKKLRCAATKLNSLIEDEDGSKVPPEKPSENSLGDHRRCRTGKSKIGSMGKTGAPTEEDVVEATESQVKVENIEVDEEVGNARKRKHASLEVKMESIKADGEVGNARKRKHASLKVKVESIEADGEVGNVRKKKNASSKENKKTKKRKKETDGEFVRKKDGVTCPYCQRVCCQFKVLIDHMTAKHATQTDFKENLIQMEARMHDQPINEKNNIILTCPYCSCKRRSKWMKFHLSTCHGEEPDIEDIRDRVKVEWDLLKKKYWNDYRRNRNQRLAESNPCLCHYCGFAFRFASSCQYHERHVCRDNPERRKKLLCNICNFKTGSREEYEAHRGTHDGSKNFICDLCGKSYKARSGLSMHKRVIHNLTGKTPLKLYPCPMCGRTFTQTGILKQHIEVHAEKKEHVCDICGKKFRTQKNRNWHRKRIHCSFYCSVCGLGANVLSELQEHKCSGENRRRKPPQLAEYQPSSAAQQLDTVAAEAGASLESIATAVPVTHELANVVTEEMTVHTSDALDGATIILQDMSESGQLEDGTILLQGLPMVSQDGTAIIYQTLPGGGSQGGAFDDMNVAMELQVSSDDLQVAAHHVENGNIVSDGIQGEPLETHYITLEQPGEEFMEAYCVVKQEEVNQ